MKSTAWAVLLAAAGIGLWSMASGAANRGLIATARAGETENPSPPAPLPARGARGASFRISSEKSSGPPPLVVDRSAPLLLKDAKEKPPVDPAAGPMADNSACYVCHTNFEEEEMVVVHARDDVGCIDCHGKSYAHRDDEDNITPPDVMFPQDAIDAACTECHDEHNVAAVKVLARWQQRCPNKDDPGQIVCTDCHGQHRLKVRTVRWDKKTRRLILRKSAEQAGAASGE